MNSKLQFPFISDEIEKHSSQLLKSERHLLQPGLEHFAQLLLFLHP